MKSILASFALLMFLPLLTNAAPGYGVVTLVKGQVEAVNSSGQKRALKIGDKVFESETVITQKQSAARLAMMDTNIIEIYPSSNLKIQQYLYNPKEDQKNVNLEVLQGRIKSTVKQKYDNDKNKYNVKTPVIVAGVRGTTFSAEHDIASQQSRVITFEGNVLVGKREVNDAVKEFFSVKANQTVTIDQRPAAKPEVKELPKVEQEKIKQEDKKDGLSSRRQDNSNLNTTASIQGTANPVAITNQQTSTNAEVREPAANQNQSGGVATTNSNSGETRSTDTASYPATGALPIKNPEGTNSTGEVKAPVTSVGALPPATNTQPITRDDSSSRVISTPPTSGVIAQPPAPAQSQLPVRADVPIQIQQPAPQIEREPVAIKVPVQVPLPVPQIDRSPVQSQLPQITRPVFTITQPQAQQIQNDAAAAAAALIRSLIETSGAAGRTPASLQQVPVPTFRLPPKEGFGTGSFLVPGSSGRSGGSSSGSTHFHDD